MDWLTILTAIAGALGINVVISTFVIWYIKKIYTKIKENNIKGEARSKALQAMIRSHLLEKYDYWKPKGYIPIREKDNFENLWFSYHTLGQNGVMDQVHEEILNLPTTSPRKKITNNSKSKMDPHD